MRLAIRSFKGALINGHWKRGFACLAKAFRGKKNLNEPLFPCGNSGGEQADFGGSSVLCFESDLPKSRRWLILI